MSFSVPDTTDIPQEHSLKSVLIIDSATLKDLQIGPNGITRDFNNVLQAIGSVVYFLGEGSLSIKDVQSAFFEGFQLYRERSIYKRSTETFKRIEEKIPSVTRKIQEIDELIEEARKLFQGLNDTNKQESIERLSEIQEEIQEIMDSPREETENSIEGDTKKQVSHLL